MTGKFAPGARVEIRDEEWVIRRVDPTMNHGDQLTCEGISELVRGKEAIFLTKFEDKIQILDPKSTKLVQDSSPQFSQSLLFIESHLRQSTPNDLKIHIAKEAAMDVVEYQLVPTYQALKQPRQRILIADAVGLGKTLEAGILVTELIQRGRGKRILVLTLKSMMTQFQKEFWNRFSIPLIRLDSNGLQRVRGRIPTNHNPFYYYDKSIISIDTLKQDNEFKSYLDKAYWDIIVIDEVHNVADRGTSSQRTELAQLLASKSDTLIMLSATPHDGKAKSFASLMNMLDPTAISDPNNYIKADFADKGLVVRRFKHDIKDQVKAEFKDRKVFSLKYQASAQEELAYEALLKVPFTIKGQYNSEKPGQLVRIGLQKALFSSPAACLKSVEQRIKKLNAKDELITAAVEQEFDSLQALKDCLEQLDTSTFTKYTKLIELLKSPEFNWDKRNTEDRIVIFSERIETLNFLESTLSHDLGLNKDQIQQLHGGMDDITQQEIVEKFSKHEEKVRILLCSDVASEGINLHHLSHRLVHFDLPWSLMVFQQRNGRVDRYGQAQEPEIYYLITESSNETIRGDVRILEILQKKDDQAYKNIGDPATFLDVYDVAEEEKLVAEAMLTMQTEEFDTQYVPENKPNEGDAILADFFGSFDEDPIVDIQLQEPKDNFKLFECEYEFAKRALSHLNKDQRRIAVEFEDAIKKIKLTAPDDLKQKFKAYPPEIYPEHGEFILTEDKENYMEVVKASRNEENSWPKEHYLWKRHPVAEWLQERMLGNTGRNEALVIGLNTQIEQDEAIFLVSALIPNRKAHPVIWEWYAVHTKAKQISKIEPLQDMLNVYGPILKNAPNTGLPINSDVLHDLRSAVVDSIHQEVLKKKVSFDEEMQPKLAEQLEKLSALKGKQEQQLQLDFDQGLESVAQTKKEAKQRYIDQVFKEYEVWMKDTWQTESLPYIQLIAVIAATKN
ncbi:DEAD/DEAH box helicase [Acinetobacter venetianus]|uniref:DEAD/DEAH box helicase n=1 Tax=Acinetobacter venetianus TaxID=52133 RepID=UPI00177D865F|nr:DEAD/DEAH box helicase [Acinetobacter venetianus]